LQDLWKRQRMMRPSLFTQQKSTTAHNLKEATELYLEEFPNIKKKKV
jgi:hypothetical protein